MVDLDVIDKAECPSLAILALYRDAFGPVWDSLKKLDGFPKVNSATADKIVSRIMDTFPCEKVAVGMLWVNRGFGVDDTLPDGEVRLCGYEL